MSEVQVRIGFTRGEHPKEGVWQTHVPLIPGCPPEHSAEQPWPGWGPALGWASPETPMLQGET